MNQIRKIYMYLAVTMMILASFACNYSRRSAGQPIVTDPVATVGIDELQEVPLDSKGQLRIVVDEAQLTSIIVTELDSQESRAIRDPQIFLRNSQMILTGKVQQSGLDADIEMIMEVGVTSDGKPDVSLVSTTVGIFSLPQNMLDNLSAQIKSAFESKISQGIDEIYIERITIGDGEMIIQGHAR